MQTPFTKIILLVLLIFSTSIPQNNPTTYPYGGKPDTTRMNIWLRIPPINFSNKATFLLAKFNYGTDFREAKFHGTAYFLEAHFDSAAYFGKAQFHSEANFNKVRFDTVTSFLEAQFSSTAYFERAQFHGTTSFWMTQFSSTANFFGANFDSNANFRDALFESGANFGYTQFKGPVDFFGAYFDSRTNFVGAEFEGKVSFEGCSFNNILNLAEVGFSKGADFKRTDLAGVDIIYIDHRLNFPEGKFLFYWDQLKGKNALRIKLWNPPHTDIVADSVNEHYQRIETFYYQLRDNFLAQGDKSSADAVMYELGWQREEIKKEWWWILYGWFFGRGYQPWRFLIFIVCPLIVFFSFIWFKFFYHLVIPIVHQKDPPGYSKNLSGSEYFVRKSFLKRFNLTMFNHAKIPPDYISYLARFWQVIHFSTSVLLGIRFKKEWIEMKERRFLYIVTIEWVIGIICYVSFALLVKGLRFGFIRDLLGF